MDSRAVTEFPLKGKIALVTGGGSGIGLSFVRLAHAKGASIIIGDLCLTAEAEAFAATAKDTVVFQHCDVRKRSDFENLIIRSQEKFNGVPDIYVPGAGIFEPSWSNFWSDTELDTYASIEINLTHPLKLTRIAMRSLLGKDKPGVVLLIASVAGLAPIYSASLYCTTKHGVVAFARCMARADGEEGVRVVAICPGIVKTPLWTNRPEIMAKYSFAEEFAQSPDEVAADMIKMVEDCVGFPGGTVAETSIRELRIAPLPEDAIKAGELELRGDRERQERRDQSVKEKMKDERGRLL